jgi:DnaK suppressor protein
MEKAVLTKGSKAKTTSKTTKPKAAAKPVVKKAAPKKADVKKTSKPVAKSAPKAVGKTVAKTTAKAAPKKAAPVAAKKAVPAKAVPVKQAPVKKAATPVKSAPVSKNIVPAKAELPISVPRKKVATTNVTILPPDYDPKKDKGEFMNAVMLEYFRQKLIRWREELIRESSETIHQTLQNTELQKPDLADRASAETDHALELRTRDRERKLISKINEALLRIEDGTYGYCEETGEPITVARLDARPNATLSIEAQERHERMERTHRDE